MEYMTISEVSKKYAISTRMLRHYEKVGLIESMHREDKAGIVELGRTIATVIAGNLLFTVG